MNQQEANSILLVDDETDLREVLADFLGDEGYRVVQVENGLKALEYLRSNEAPKLIILDYMMPLMGGRQFCAERAKVPSFRAIPTIVITAAKLSDKDLEAMQVQSLILKPIDMDSLLQEIKRFYRGG